MDYIESLQKARRRRKRVMAYRKQKWTFEKIGKKLGISAQRAHKIWSEEDRRFVGKLYTNSSGNKR